MGEVVPARTSPTLHPPSPPTVHQLLRLALYELKTTEISIHLILWNFPVMNVCIDESTHYRKTHNG